MAIAHLANQDSKVGDRVSVIDKRTSPLGTITEGFVEATEWASFFNATYLVVRLDDGTKMRIVVY